MQDKQEFKNKFQIEAKYEIIVPSRVNLIGEHSDYFGNFVMSMAVENVKMKSYLCPRDDDKVRMFSVNLSESKGITNGNYKPFEEFSVLDDRINDQWVQYVQGAIAMYAEEYTRRKLKGFDLLIDSSIPVGGGLSSSSALTMTAIVALGIANGFTDGAKNYTPEEGLAILNKKDDSETTKNLFRKLFMMGCWSEYWYGTRGGFNDHLAMTVGKKGVASVSDNFKKDYEYVPLPQGLSIVICNTMVRHNQLYSEYDNRKKDAWHGFAKLNHYVPSAKNVRDISLELLEEHKNELTENEYKRLLHPITEKQRVFDFIDALKERDFAKAGELLNKTHESLRRNYEVSCNELNIMQRAAVNSPGCYGARLVGGGFGGCVIALVDESKKNDFIVRVKKQYDNDPEISVLEIDSEIWEAVSGEGILVNEL